jgi:endonuclease YncB( thermonuclease family)
MIDRESSSRAFVAVAFAACLLGQTNGEAIAADKSAVKTENVAEIVKTAAPTPQADAEKKKTSVMDAIGEAAAPESAFDIRGVASVVTAGVIDVAGKRMRLHGIDPLEGAQKCLTRQGREWKCGEKAKTALAERTREGEVVCKKKGTDRRGVDIASCKAGEDDLSAWMIAAGWAFPARRLSTEFLPQEASAKAGALGAWSGIFIMPHDWRAGTRFGIPAFASDAPRAPDGTILPVDQDDPDPAIQCMIKGNVGRNGERIYHVPGGAYYDKVVIDPGAGKTWFCTEAEAVAAGWRKSPR